MLTDFEGFFQQFFQGMHQFWGWGGREVYK